MPYHLIVIFEFYNFSILDIFMSSSALMNLLRHDWAEPQEFVLKYSILYVSEIVIENKFYKCLNLEKFGVELKVKW